MIGRGLQSSEHAVRYSALSQNEVEHHSVNKQLGLPFLSTEQVDFFCGRPASSKCLTSFSHLWLVCVSACQSTQDGCHSPRHVRRNGEILDVDTGSDSTLEPEFRECINPSFRCQDLHLSILISTE